MTTFLSLIRQAEVKRRTALSHTRFHELRKAKQFPEPTGQLPVPWTPT